MSFFTPSYSLFPSGWLSSRYFQISSLLIICYISYRIRWELSVGLSHRRKIRQNGCKPPKKLFTWDPILGLDEIARSLKMLKEHTLLAGSHQRFLDINKSTVKANSLGQEILVTHEAENIKTILAVNFKSWGIGAARKELVPIFGHGIFTTDGEAWQHSRDMLRPSFIRSQVADLQLFETHVANFIRAIPRDGSTIDLQPLFFRLTLDTATEFLFGQSTNSLVPDNRSVDTFEFAEAFNYCTRVIAGRESKFGLLSIFLPRSTEFKRSCKMVHGKQAH